MAFFFELAFTKAKNQLSSYPLPYFLAFTKYKYKYKIKTYNAPYVTRVIRRRGGHTVTVTDFELSTFSFCQLSSNLLLADFCRTITLGVHPAGLFGHGYAQDASQQFAEDIDVWNGRRWKTSQVDR